MHYSICYLRMTCHKETFHLIQFLENLFSNSTKIYITIRYLTPTTMFHLRRYSSKATANFFQLFPKSSSSNSFKVDLKSLRKEYRQLQSQYHPDRNNAINTTTASSSIASEIDPSTLNKAYDTLKSPLLRAQYLLKQKGIDLTDDSLNINNDPELLMEILEIHDNLETCSSEEELSSLKQQNDQRLRETEEQLSTAFAKGDLQTASELTIRLKYWLNVNQSIKNWEVGKPVNLTH